MKLNIAIPKPIHKILSVLYEAGGKPRIVGGAVRDSIIGIDNSDLDLITIFDPKRVTDILTSNKIKVKATGIKYGTVTAILDGYNTQITTLRLDKDCDGRYTNPEFTDDFEVDSKRRDFTINAMSYCPFEEKLYDYNGGYNDILKRRVVFIGEPLLRIEEDYLRILRFFRFSDKFAKNIDKKSLEACVQLKAGLTKLSKERVLMELKKLLESPNCHKTLRVMLENNILTEVMKLDISLDLLDEINEHTEKADICTRFAALIYKNETATLRKELYQMHFAIREIDRIISLLEFRNKNPNPASASLDKIKDVFYHLWVDQTYHDSYMFITECWKSEHYEFLCQKMQQKPPIFPVKGNDLLSHGIRGRNIKSALTKMKDAWIASDFRMSKDELMLHFQDEISGNI